MTYIIVLKIYKILILLLQLNLSARAIDRNEEAIFQTLKI